ILVAIGAAGLILGVIVVLLVIKHNNDNNKKKNQTAVTAPAAGAPATVAPAAAGQPVVLAPLPIPAGKQALAIQVGYIAGGAGYAGHEPGLPAGGRREPSRAGDLPVDVRVDLPLDRAEEPAGGPDSRSGVPGPALKTGGSLRNPKILVLDRSETLADQVRGLVDDLRPRPEVHVCTRVGAVGDVMDTDGPF